MNLPTMCWNHCWKTHFKNKKRSFKNQRKMSSSLKFELKNLTNSYKVITDVISKKVVGLKFKEDAILLRVLEYHPMKHIPKKNIEYLVVRLRPPYYTRSLYYKLTDSIEDDVSYKMCLQVLFGKFDKKESDKESIMTALRSECKYGTRKTYFLTNTIKTNNIYSGYCCLCRKTTPNITVDHVGITFRNILDRFLEHKTDVKLESFEIYENQTNELRLKDVHLAKEWLNFHDTLANYRLLCSSCNSRCGGHGYSSQRFTP